MKFRIALATLSAGILSLAMIAPVAAASDAHAEIAGSAIAPAGPGDGGQPADPGRPSDPGQPDGVAPQHHEIPDLPENASPRAHAAVQATYDRFAAISARIDEIRAIEPGPDRNAALNELFSEFGGMIHTVSDAVHEVDVESSGQADAEEAEDAAAEATLNPDDDEDADVDSEGDQTDDDEPDGESDRDRNRDKDSDGDESDGVTSTDGDSERSRNRDGERTRDASDEHDPSDDLSSTGSSDRKD